MSYQDNITARNPVSYWRMSVSGTGGGGEKLFSDLGTLNNEATEVGTVTEVAGLLVDDPDEAISFTGSGRVEAPHNAAYSINNTGQLSVEFIMDVGSDTSTIQVLVTKGYGGGAGEREWNIFLLNGDTLRAIVYEDDGGILQLSQVPIAAQTKYHVGINFTGTTEVDEIEIVLDGVQQTPTTGNSPDSEPMAVGTSDVAIGARINGTNPLNDTVLDEVAIYDFNLTESQYNDDFLAMEGIVPRVASAHTAVWSLRLAEAHAAVIPLRVGAAHTALIHSRVRSAHTAAWSLLHRVQSAHVAVFPLQEFIPVRAAHTAVITMRVAAAHAAVAPLMAFVRRAHAAVWDLRIDVRTAHAANVPLLDHDPVRAAHTAVFSLLAAPRTSVDMAVTLTAGDRTIPVLSWNIHADEGGYLYEGEIDVDANGYRMVRVNDSITLDLFGEAYSLVVESRRRDKRGPAGRRFVLGVRSPTVRFDFPRAAPVTRTFDQSVLAREAVEALLGEAVSWEIVNWRIPAFRLAWEEVSPIAAAQQIIESAGGIIQSDPDGTLRIRHLYPVSPKKLYRGAAAARVIDDQDDVTASSESFEPRRLVDRITIRDTVEGVFSDRIEFIPDEDDDRAGLVQVYPSPWRTNLVVTHTSNASLQLTEIGETTREETEVVEFTAGTATLRYPVDALLSVTWLYQSLGGLAFEPNATELQAADTDGYSLAEIRYQTRSIDYRLLSPTVNQAQLLLQEVA